MKIAELQQRLSRYPEIVAAYFFGSAATGRLIYERDRETHREFVARTVIAFLDFQPFYETALRNYSRSLRRGKSQHHSEKDRFHS
ncbi:MAG: nucleotidyltransferase domain-containing protein [candidate division KSB1 bacterium]|nr:nucleotidyltransferase domain-containing protein [candidate division KSB1 bacterium]MDZ7367891.1 nucleotidyltransferase domain-containing protein [candidate division KSB1 bacterium]